MGENSFASIPTAVYGAIMLIAAIAYWVLQNAIMRTQGADSTLRRAVGRDWKGKVSPLLYALAIVLAPFTRWVSLGLYVVVALIWLIPDRRIERVLGETPA